MQKNHYQTYFFRLLLAAAIAPSFLYNYLISNTERKIQSIFGRENCYMVTVWVENASDLTLK